MADIFQESDYDRSTMTAPLTIDPAPRLPEEGRRSRKKQQTRELLMQAAHELFATQGFDATTTNDIAERADVSQRTLFRHFDTKEAVLYGDMDDARLQLRDAFTRVPANVGVVNAVRQAIGSLAEDHERNRDRRLMQARLAATSASVSGHFRAVVQLGWEREIIAAVAERLDVDPMVDPRPEVLAGAAMSAMRVATRQWTASNGAVDYLELAEGALDAITDIASLN